jgi:hypothetical protein
MLLLITRTILYANTLGSEDSYDALQIPQAEETKRVKRQLWHRRAQNYERS